MKSKLVLGGVLVAVVAVVYFTTLYPWPGKDNVQGTIGGAKKYQSQQISDKDVKLEGQKEGSETKKADQRDAAFFRSASIEQQAQIMRTADVQRVADLYRSLDIQKQAEITRSADIQRVADIFRSADIQKQAEIARTADIQRVADIFRTAPIEMRDQLQKQADLNNKPTQE